MELSKMSQTNYCIDSIIEEKLEDFKLFEKLSLSFMNTPMDQFKSLSDFYKNINVNCVELKKYIQDNQQNFDSDIIKINEVNSLFLKEFNKFESQNLKSLHNKDNNKNNDNHIKNLINYICFLNLRLFFYIVLSTKFEYATSEDHWTKTYIKNLFKIYKTNNRIISSNSGTGTNGTGSFAENFNIISIFINIPKDIFEDMIGIFHNYLTIYLYDIASLNNEEDDEIGPPVFDRKEMEQFMEVFNILWEINRQYKIVHFKLFNNETASKNFDINEDCKIFIHNFNKKKAKESKMQIDSGNGNGIEDEDNYKFSLINYNWLFDSSRKSDILYAFNYKKQRQEIVSSLNMMLGNPNNPLNLNALQHINLLFEVRRTHLIEDTMNLVSNPNFNLRKQLRVYIYIIV